jgi:hypothetical protein
VNERVRNLPTLAQKKEWIATDEQKLASFVARKVIEKPELSVWLILIPIFFVYFFYRLKKVTDGRKEFAHNFMITRRRVLEAAHDGLESGQPPDLNQLCRMSSSPEATYDKYTAWLKVLLQHYENLLQADGDSIEDLIRSVYHTRANYLLLLHQLHQAEKQFNTALAPHLDDSINDVTTIVKAMENHSEAYRREQAEEIFSGIH